MKSKEDMNDDYVNADTAQPITEYQRHFNCLQSEHIIFELLWHTGMRNGALHTINLDDYNDFTLEAYHRPDDGNLLKNGKEGKRVVSLKMKANQLVQDDTNNYQFVKADNAGREVVNHY